MSLISHKTSIFHYRNILYICSVYLVFLVSVIGSIINTTVIKMVVGKFELRMTAAVCKSLV